MGHFWQPKLPSHLPFVMQVLCNVVAHIPRGSGDPAAVGVHLPSIDATPQLRQAPEHSLSQQIPSTQKLCWHSLA